MSPNLILLVVVSLRISIGQIADSIPFSAKLEFHLETGVLSYSGSPWRGRWAPAVWGMLLPVCTLKSQPTST